MRKIVVVFNFTVLSSVKISTFMVQFCCQCVNSVVWRTNLGGFSPPIPPLPTPMVFKLANARGRQPFLYTTQHQNWRG